MRSIYPTVSNAQSAPNRVAVRDDRQTLTCAQLEATVQRDARRLLVLGVTPGQRVAVIAENSVALISLIHATVRVGAIFAPLNPRWSATETTAVLQRLQPSVVICGDDCARRFPDDATDEAIPHVTLDHERDSWQRWDALDGGTRDIPTDIETDTVCSIIATSGSTGEPKLVALSYANHYASAKASEVLLGHDGTDCWLINLPLCHVGGLAIVHRAAVSGFAVCVQRGFDAEHTLKAITEYGVTHLSLVSTTLRRLLDHNGGQRMPGTVKAVLVGGGATDVALLQKARRIGLPVLPTYGMTETASQAATMPPGTPLDEEIVRARPLPSCEIEVRDDKGNRVAPGATGRICIRGPMVARGYWRADGSLERLSSDGWFVTDDLGEIDRDGWLRVIGRHDDVIVSGGENISLTEVEEAFSRLPDVRRAAVIGVPDPQWGQSSVAFVEGDANAEALQAALRESLASFKMPRAIIIVDRMPETSIGKIDRQSLKQLVPVDRNGGAA